MADANQLKIRARREEAAGDYAQASRLYRRALSAMADDDDLPDPSLLVRVADLEYRQDGSEKALEYYRRAVDEYAGQGLITNAIAVCNKILRVYPDCVDCLRRLADLHLDVGLAAEARQNLMTYVDRAWDPEAPGPVLEAMREFLDRTPDQDVALRLSAHLEELGRTRQGLHVLREIWELRTRDGADVESLEHRAREMEPGLDLEEWDGGDVADGAPEDAAPAEGSPRPADGGSGSPSGTDGGETTEAGGAGTSGVDVGGSDGLPAWAPAASAAPARDATAAGRRRGEAVGGRPPPPPGLSEESGAAAPRHDERGLELLASYRERFTEIAARGPELGGSPSPGAAPPEQENEEQAMDDRDRGNETATTGTSWWEEDDLQTSGGADPGESPDASPPEPGASAPEAGASAPETSDPETAARETDLPQSRTPPSPGGSDDELGEEAELRRGLELVDEMLEVQPDSLKLRERKVRYARRLGDRETLVDAYLDLAERLGQEESRRSARALYREVLELEPGNEAAEAGLARLDVGELEDKRQSGKRAGAAHRTPEAATPEEQEARRELGMRLWTEFENSIREMPWLHAATQAYQAAGPDSLPPLETFEMLAHYLMARGRHRDAAEILARSLELAGDEDDRMADVLYQLGVAHEKLGEEGEAEEYFRRLEAVDPEFSRVRSAIRDSAPEV